MAEFRKSDQRLAQPLLPAGIRCSEFGFRTRFPNPEPRTPSPACRLTSLAGTLVLLMLVAAGCRNDMHQAPRYDPLSASSFFSDGRSERPMLAGTVPHGELRTDELRYTGKINGVTANEFPFPITRQDLERGRQRFNIYCSPCHDYTGSGHGVVVQRGLLQPPSYHSEKLMKAPVGQFFEVITNGFGQMYSYAGRVSPDDRWRIAAYIRALQLSESATINDVPADQRQQLDQKSQ
jgi:mono/diheme cytochrome c family protein